MSDVLKSSLDTRKHARHHFSPIADTRAECPIRALCASVIEAALACPGECIFIELGRAATTSITAA